MTAVWLRLALLPAVSMMVPLFKLRLLVSMLMPLMSVCPAKTVYVKVKAVVPLPLA